MIEYIIISLTLILGGVLQMFYTVTNTFPLTYYISPHYVKTNEPQTDHLMRWTGILENARGPPKINGLRLKSLKL